MVFMAFFGLNLSVFGQQQDKEEKAKGKKDEDKMSLEDEQNRGEMQKNIEEPRLSNKWFRGNYLIYDCDKGFYACVNRPSFIKCTDQRTIRIEERRPALGCAPLKRFDSQKECFKVQYEKVHNQVPKLFCVHPNFR